MNVAPYEFSESPVDPTTGETTVTLLAPLPLDDGGMPVQGYVLEQRHVDHDMRQEWTAVGSFPNQLAPGGGKVIMKVDHLLPHCGYQFRLSAYNQVGRSVGRSVSQSASQLGR